jgi:tRNA A37 methylthiotransferase MiaB
VKQKRIWSRKAREKFLGETLAMVVEEREEKGWSGHTENYILVRVDQEDLPRGKIVPVKILEVKEDYAWGVVTDRPENCGNSPS